MLRRIIHYQLQTALHSI